jgi:hypothetical protein
MAHLSPPLRQVFYDLNGVRLAGGKIFSYAAGTTSPLTTYADKTEAAPNTNPVILDSLGEADIWLKDVPYKIVIKDSLDNILKTINNVAHYNLASITTAMMANDAVDKTIIAADVAGNGLVQNVSGALDVNVDDSTIEIHLDIVRVKAAGITANELAADSVPTSKIVNLNVTTPKLADKLITKPKLSDAVVALLAGSSYLNWRYAALLVERSFTSASNVITIHDHGLLDGQVLYFAATSGTTPPTVNTVYYAKVTGQNTFNIATTPGGGTVTVGTATGTCYVVPEKCNWSSVVMGSRNVLVAVASTGTARTMYSADYGDKWIAVVAAEANPWASIAASANKFVAVAPTGTNRTMYSADRGATWTAVAAATAGAWAAVCFNPNTGTFVAVGTSGTAANRGMRSTNDGVSWSGIATMPNANYIAIAASSGGTILAGATVSASSAFIVRSTDDGVTWSIISTSFTVNSIAYHNGVWIATSTDANGTVFYSTDDGLTWASQGVGKDSAAQRAMDDCQFLSCAGGNGVFVVTGVSTLSGKIIFASFDAGATWQATGAPTLGSLNGVTYGAGIFLAVGDDQVNRAMKSLMAIEV